MADVAGLVASITGIVGFAAKVCNLCYGYYGEVKDAQDDINRLTTEISSLADMLEPLSTPAKASKILQTPDSDSDSMSQLVHKFTEILKQLQDELQPQIDKQSDGKIQKAMRSVKARFMWPFKKADNQRRIQEIERLKTSVILKLQLWVAHIFRCQTPC